MSDAYEPFLIPVEVIGGKDAESTLKNIDSKLKEISENLIDVGYGADAMKILTANMRDLSSVSKTVASGISSLNKANAQAAKDAESVALAHQKVATEAGKTARELEKAKTQAANTAIANQKLSTEMEKTATAHARAEMAALRVAQAHEKQALKAQQAARPYNQLNQQLREQAQKLQDAIVKNNVHGAALTSLLGKYNELKTKLQNVNQKFAELTKTQQDNINATDTLKIAIGSFFGVLANQVLQKSIQAFKDFATSISKAGIELDALNNTMLAATGGWETGKQEIGWIIDMSNRLGLAFGDVSDSYAKFMTSFTRSGGTISQSRQIFEDLSTAMVSLHLPAERMQGVFVALEQMANKGTVQAEELKRQLSNALPGAFELAAESMGILPARLMELMKKGEVFSKDFLPAFAATVKAALGQAIDIASMQFNASIARLRTATDLLKMNLGQIVNEALLPFVNALVKITQVMANTVKFFNENEVASTALKTTLVGLGIAIGSLAWNSLIAGLMQVKLAMLAVGTEAIVSFGTSGKIATALVGLQTSISGIYPALIAMGNAIKAAVSGAVLGSVNALKAAFVSLGVFLKADLTVKVATLSGGLKALGTAMLAPARGIIGIATSIKTTLLPALGELNIATAGIPLLIGAVIVGLTTLGFYLADTAKKASDVTPYIGLATQITNLTKEITTLDATTDEGKQKLEEYKKTFPELTKYLSSTGKKFEELSKKELEHIAVLGEHDAKMRALNERTKELSSWQSFLSAACIVAWEKICMWAKILRQRINNTFKDIGEAIIWFIDLLGKAARKMAEWGKQVAPIMQTVGKATGLPLVEGFGIALEAQSNFILDWDKNIAEMKKTVSGWGKAVKDGWENSAAVAEINAKRISIANNNYLKKMELIKKNSKMTYDSLIQSQSAVSGLQAGGEDGKKGKVKSAKVKKKEADDEWQALQKRQAAITEQIRVNTLLHKSTTDLEKEYEKNQAGIDRVTRAIQELNKAEKKINMTEAEKAIKTWKEKKESLQDAENLYKGMLLAGNSYTRTQLQQQRETMKVSKAEVAYYEQLEKQEDLMKITSRTAQQFTNSVFDSLFEPLREGETLWTRFKDAGVNALKSIAQTWTKQFLQNIVTGFGAGFTTNRVNGATFLQSLAGGLTGSITQIAKAPLQTNIFGIKSNQQGQQQKQSGGILENIWSSVKNLFGGGSNAGQATGAASPIGAITDVGTVGQSILDGLNTSANTLTQTLRYATSPAVSGVLENITNLGTSALGTGTNIMSMANSALGAGSSILGMANPAISAAQSIASMAVAAPIAATGMGALAATMVIASGSFQKSAPALKQMAGAMGTLASSAAAAATSMAAIAVANAANSAAQIPFVGWLLAPLAAIMTGAGIAAGTALTGAAIGASTAMAGAGQMLGGAMAGIGNQLSGVSGLSKGSSTTNSAKVIPHAKGGIVSSPTMFPMQGGNFGLAGEAGTEVIAPARRMSNGDVGIGAVQPQVTVNNYTNAAVEVIKRPNNEMEIKISELNSMLSSSKTNKGWVNAQTRMSKQGKQIG